MTALEDIVREHLGNERVRSVYDVHSQNADGEPVLRIFVVYDGDKKAPTIEEMQNITSDLWSETLREGRPDMVVPSFISSRDARERQSA